MSMKLRPQDIDIDNIEDEGVVIEDASKTDWKSDKSLAGYIVLGVAGILAIIVIIISVVQAYADAPRKKAVGEPPAEAAETAEVAETTEATADVMEATEEPVDVSTEYSGGSMEVVADDTYNTDTDETISNTAADWTVEELVNSNADWHFYNLDLQDDGNAENDFDFGSNPILSNLSVDKLKDLVKSRGLKGTVKIEEIVSVTEVADIDADFRARLHEDPALGAADMAWLDSIVGTRYLGVFYSEAKEKWDVAMNDAKDAFIADPATYYATLDAFEEYLDKATKVELKKVDSGLTDQMYMNPSTVSKIPDIVVLETDNHDGWFLVYTFTIKGTTTKEVMYRLDCGYQPTNVAEVMKVTPKKKSSITGGGTSSKISGGGKTTSVISGGGKTTTTTATTTGGGGSGGGGGGSKKKYNKDPKKGTVVLPNDDPGPGENTNGDPNWSSKDQPTNSNHMTPAEYQEAIKELKDANDTSREAGDPNTPTYTPPDSGHTNVDSNAETGTGNGGIDQATPVQDSSVRKDQAGSQWDGPPD